MHFRRRDFFDGRPGPLGDAVRDLVEERLGRRPDGPVYLLAHLRTFGWLFNPLAVYYCWSTDGHALDALVLEVTNTPWGERHWYVVDARVVTGAHVVSKALHVSPFLPMDVDYQLSWTAPRDTLRLDIAVAARAKRSSRRASRCADGYSTGGTRSASSSAIPRYRFAYRSRSTAKPWRCSSTACPPTVIHRGRCRRSTHDLAEPYGAARW